MMRPFVDLAARQCGRCGIHVYPSRISPRKTGSSCEYSMCSAGLGCNACTAAALVADLERHAPCLRYGTERTMPKNPTDSKQKPEQRDTDTAQYEQLHGAQEPETKPNRRDEKMPHER